MNDFRKAAESVVERWCRPDIGVQASDSILVERILKLRDALANEPVNDPVNDPVAWICEVPVSGGLWQERLTFHKPTHPNCVNVMPLYTSPPNVRRLSADEVDAIWLSIRCEPCSVRTFGEELRAFATVIQDACGIPKE